MPNSNSVVEISTTEQWRKVKSGLVSFVLDERLQLSPSGDGEAWQTLPGARANQDASWRPDEKWLA